MLFLQAIFYVLKRARSRLRWLSRKGTCLSFSPAIKNTLSCIHTFCPADQSSFWAAFITTVCKYKSILEVCRR